MINYWLEFWNIKAVNINYGFEWTFCSKSCSKICMFIIFTTLPKFFYLWCKNQNYLVTFTMFCKND